MSEKFWLNDISVLPKNYLNFFPNENNTNIENLNAITRLGIYTSILLSMYHRNSKYLFLSVIVYSITFFIYQYYDLENFENNDYGIDMEELQNKGYTLPTLNNPMMNVMLTDYTENPYRGPAYPVGDASKESYFVKRDMENKLNYNLTRDTGDIYNNKYGQMNYYTMPSQTIPNDRKKLTDFLSKDMQPSCKENRYYCERYRDLRNNSPYVFQNEKLKENLR